MLLTITISLFVLVAINLLLLKFSCNKTLKPTEVNKKPVVLRPQIQIESVELTLAPTGS